MLDRYQLGAKVTGTIACGWLDRWSAARRQGDAEGVRIAISAMGTARRWKILREMQSQGDWSEVLWGYADAMRQGSYGGRPLMQGASTGLACADG